VLATVRAANLMAVAQLPGLGPVIGSSLYLLMAPRDETQLRDIAVEPARLTNRTLDDGVTRRLVAEAARGALPLGDLTKRLAALWDSA
jgi:hypothetical protein